MLRSGYLENVYSLSQHERTINFPDHPELPPLILHQFYKGDKPILCLIWCQQSTYPQKIIILDEIQLEENKKELRLRYHIIGDKPKMRGKWAFGQFATFVPHEDFKEIIELAKTHKMI